MACRNSIANLIFAVGETTVSERVNGCNADIIVGRMKKDKALDELSQKGIAASVFGAKFLRRYRVIHFF